VRARIVSGTVWAAGEHAKTIGKGGDLLRVRAVAVEVVSVDERNRNRRERLAIEPAISAKLIIRACAQLTLLSFLLYSCGTQ
jgi:hypothetical protein